MRRALLTAGVGLTPGVIGALESQYPGGAGSLTMRVFINALNAGASATTMIQTLRLDPSSASGTATFFTTTSPSGTSGSGQAIIKAVGPTVSLNAANEVVVSAAGLAVDAGDLLGVYCSTTITLQEITGTGHSMWYRAGAVSAPVVGNSYTSLSRTLGKHFALRGSTP